MNKTCKNCGLEIIWEGMIKLVSGGFICHPDCKRGSKKPIPLAPSEPVPIQSKKKWKKGKKR